MSTTTNISEKGLEALIVASMTGAQAATAAPVAGTKQTAAPSHIPGWIPGDLHDYDRAHAIDLMQPAFLFDTQPNAAALDLDHDSPIR